MDLERVSGDVRWVDMISAMLFIHDPPSMLDSSQH